MCEILLGSFFFVESRRSWRLN